MDWSNRFTLGGFTVSYYTFEMALEVIEKKMTINSPTTGSPPNKKQKIFALDGSCPSSRFFFFKMKIKKCANSGLNSGECMEIRETPFVLIARVMVKSGKVEEYMKIASTVDEAVEKTEPGMLFHHFDSDPANELKFLWTEIYKNDEALIFHINNPPVGEYVEKHLELAESIEIEIYGQLADDTIDILTQAWGEAKIPFKLFKTTRVGYFRKSIFG